MVDIQSAAAEIRRGKKKKKEEARKKPQGKNIMSASAPQGGRNKFMAEMKRDGSSVLFYNYR